MLCGFANFSRLQNIGFSPPFTKTISCKKEKKINQFFFSLANSFKTGMEPGLICYQCVGTHPGCGLYNFDSRWYWGKICPRSNDRCVKLIERKGADIMVTRDCLSNLEGHRVDIPADKYEGCRTATPEIKLGQYTFNTIKELDTKR